MQSSTFETDHAVSELRNHVGYKWVIEQIQTEHNAIEGQLEKSDSSAVDVSLLAQWKAYRKVLRRLRNLPIECEKRALAHINGPNN